MALIGAHNGYLRRGSGMMPYCQYHMDYNLGHLESQIFMSSPLFEYLDQFCLVLVYPASLLDLLSDEIHQYPLLLVYN